MFCIKIYFSELEPVGVEILWVEPEPRFFTQSRKKIWAGAEEKWTGSAKPSGSFVTYRYPVKINAAEANFYHSGSTFLSLHIWYCIDSISAPPQKRTHFFFVYQIALELDLYRYFLRN